MGALADIWKSERGLVAIAYMIAVTAAMLVGKITSDQWLTQMQTVMAVYIGSKTLTGAVQIAKGSTAPAPTPDATPAPAVDPITPTPA